MLGIKLYHGHYRPLINLGLPIIIGNVGLIILGLFDTLMIGHHSTQELAAAAFVNNIFVIVLLFALGFAYGLTPLVGNHYGRGEYHLIGKWVKNSLVANTLVALVGMGALTLVYLNVDKMGQPEELLPYIKPYFIISIVSLPFVIWFNTLKQLADGITFTRIAMWLMLCGNLINIIGNWLLIYGHGGFPELGLIGAGIATFFSRMVMVLVFFLIFIFDKRFKIYYDSFRQSHFEKKAFVRLNKLGLPLSLQMGMETAAFGLSSVMVGWIGTLSLAAHQIMLSISSCFYMVYYGVGGAVTIRASHFFGMRDLSNISRTSAAGFHLTMLLALLFSVPVILLRNELGSWFSDDTMVCAIVAATVTPLIVYQFGDGLQCIYASALRAMADVVPLMYIAFVAYFVLSLPLGYLFGIVWEWGLVGIWFAFPIGLTTAGVLFYYFFKRRLRIETARG